MANSIIKNNQSYVAEVFDKYQASLKAFIRKNVPTLEIAEDILQDVFYKFLKATDSLNPIEHMSGWLYRVTKNQISNWRHQKRETMLFDYSNEEDGEYIEEVADLLFYNNNQSAPTPDIDYLRDLVWKELEIALYELPIEQREIFEQMELQGISAKEISKNMGVSISTLLSRKHYAVMHLRKRLKILYYEIVEN